MTVLQQISRVPKTADAAILKGIFGGFPTGVTVVTTIDGHNKPVGLTVSAVMSVSLAPPMLAVCLQGAKYTLRAIRERGVFAVNFLARQQARLSDHFAFGADDKFASTGWRAGGETGSPILENVRAHAECAVHQIVDAGDHSIIIGHIMSGDVSETGPLTYCKRQYVDLVG
jgi:flavin reductase (DIM6/NTAB) family NADH-FMN oxidoreductase RutF